MKVDAKNWALVIALFAIVIGVGIFVFAIYYTVTEQSKLKNYTETSGVVVGYEERKSYDTTHDHTTTTTYTYAEVVEYVVDGVTYRAANDVSSTSPKSLGSVMKIAYRASDPSDCIFVNSQKWTYVFLFVFGAAVAAFGIILSVHLAKNK